MSQLFKNPIPISFLFDLLDKVCIKTDKYYLVDQDSYKKIMFHNYHDEFCNSIAPFYHQSKRMYVERPFVFNSFINIIRQICKFNNIAFSYNVKYSDKKYNIIYYIYF
mgnify:FL=1